MIFRRARENRQNIMRLLSPAQNYLKGMGNLKILKTPKMGNPDPRRPSVEKLKIGTWFHGSNLQLEYNPATGG